ncbi:MAG: PEP/pyruvate-binding domain-containing protein [Deltaproteobacteria bacterium]|nr:PEP/pyruvate-binding domain-containing protein [Deltaproteobacteria bacterium]
MSLVKSRFCIPFEESGINDTALVGGKNASLGELLKAGVRVPPGFSVSTQGYDHFFTTTGLNREIRLALEEATDFRDRLKFEEISRKIYALIEENPLPKEIEKSIKIGYQDLCEKVGIYPLAVAVRSSGTAEDLAEASLAGQHDSFLFVKGEYEVVKKVLKCWASSFTPRAILYRMRMGIAHYRSFMSVGIQKMVNAFSAGVMFTLDPVSGDNSVVAIDANFGLGESVVRGEVTPDQYVVDKIDLEIMEKKIQRKEIKYVCDLKGEDVVCVTVDEDLKETPVLNDEEIKELAETAKKIESHYGKAMDIEWALEKAAHSEKGMIHIVQARPETVWNVRREELSKTKTDLASAILSDLLKGG